MPGAKSNPNGANQWNPDPRQRLMWRLYIDPGSPTFSNAYKSAVKAGYTEESSKRITSEPWFTSKLRRLNLLNKAEDALEECVEMDCTFEVKTEDGETVKRKDAALTKIKQDTAKFIASRLGKDNYSERTELTGKDGAELPRPIIDLNVHQDDGHKEGDGHEEENQGDSGRDFGEQDDIHPAVPDSESAI